MRCDRCNRTITTASVAVTKGKWVYAFGPKCARKAGLMDARKRAPNIRTAAELPDPDQIPLPLEMAAC